MKTLSVIEKISKSKVYREIEEQEHEQLLAERTRSTEAIKTLGTEKEQKIKELRTALSDAKIKLTEAREVFNLAANEYNGTKASLLNCSNSFDWLINTEQAILLTSYDPIIDVAIEFFRDKLDSLRRPGIINSQLIESNNNLIDFTKQTTTASNLPAILDAIGYCQQVIKELENWKLLPKISIEMIESLKAGIPPTDVYTEVAGEKSMEKSQIKRIDFSLNPNIENKINRLHYITDGFLHGRKIADRNREVRENQRART